jgi:hypothetical protein
MPNNIFDLNDGIVYENPDDQSERKQRDRIQ